MCSLCAGFAEQIDIKTPGDLSHHLRELQQIVRQGTLSPVGGASSIIELAPEGPWPDVIEHTFRCAGCNQQFELSVETYHGRGGTWKVADTK